MLPKHAPMATLLPMCPVLEPTANALRCLNDPHDNPCDSAPHCPMMPNALAALCDDAPPCLAMPMVLHAMVWEAIRDTLLSQRGQARCLDRYCILSFSLQPILIIVYYQHSNYIYFDLVKFYSFLPYHDGVIIRCFGAAMDLLTFCLIIVN